MQGGNWNPCSSDTESQIRELFGSNSGAPNTVSRPRKWDISETASAYVGLVVHQNCETRQKWVFGVWWNERVS